MTSGSTACYCSGSGGNSSCAGWTGLTCHAAANCSALRAGTGPSLNSSGAWNPLTVTCSRLPADLTVESQVRPGQPLTVHAQALDSCQAVSAATTLKGDTIPEGAQHSPGSPAAALC